MLIEIAKTESGKILWEEPYIFKRLFAKGQLQVVDSVEYKTISCEKVGNEVYTVLKPVRNFKREKEYLEKLHQEG